MKKILFTFIAILCFLLGTIFLIIPGPSLLFYMVGLVLLSLHYPKAKGYLKKCQKLFKQSCIYLDNALSRISKSLR